MRRAKHALAIAAFTLASCSVSLTPATTPTTQAVTLRLYATTATQSFARQLTTAYQLEHPLVQFEIETGDFQAMQASLVEGRTPFFLSNHVPLPNQSPTVQAWPLAQDALAVVVHPSNPLNNLSSDQLRLIFRGHVANWSALGGDDRAVTIISREDGSGTRAEFERLVMGARTTTPAAQIALTSAAVIDLVAANVGAIGYVALGELSSSETRMRVVGLDGVLPSLTSVLEHRYPLRTTLYMVGLEEPRGEYFRFLSWAQSAAGQAVIATHYAPLTAGVSS